MADTMAKTQISPQSACETICRTCGRNFISRKYRQEASQISAHKLPAYCPLCYRAMLDQKKQNAEQKANEAWLREKAAAQKLFDARLKNWNTVASDDIRPGNDRVLYVIGNGFDLMHCVRSSYSAFRDSLGMRSPLRHSLENFLTVDDIWADFENALAHFNIKAMCSSFMLDNWLDIFDAYGKDAGFSDFSLAVEAAADPILTVVNELPRRFRMWVESLSIGTKDRPLRHMFRNGKVLCFNYTEFVETLYDIPEANVCYIHGCRRKKKYHPKETLVLGHLPGAGEEEYDFTDDSPVKVKDPYKQYMIQAAQEYAFRLVSESDAALTKNCDKIIDAHKSFFAGLGGIGTVIVIGHSLAPVDWRYFSEIFSRLSDAGHTKWYFGCHGLHDLENLERLLAWLGISRGSVTVFRTDTISASPLKSEKIPSHPKTDPSLKTRHASADGRWTVYSGGRLLSVFDNTAQKTVYETIFFAPVSSAFFVPSGEYLFVIIRGVHAGIFLLRLADGHWKFVDELKSIPNQNLINPRLNHVFLSDHEITFVYNSRVRKYSLSDGTLVSNQARQRAGSYTYGGENISHLFFSGERGR